MAASRGNVGLFCGVGNHSGSRGLPGGAQGIRTSDLRGAGTRGATAARKRRFLKTTLFLSRPRSWQKGDGLPRSPRHRGLCDGHGQGFDHYCEWLDRQGYHGTDWVPHDAKMREAGAPGARTRIETLLSLGRKPELASGAVADGRRQRRPQHNLVRSL
jgi:hypothetical protein